MLETQGGELLSCPICAQVQQERQKLFEKWRMQDEIARKNGLYTCKKCNLTLDTFWAYIGHVNSYKEENN
jgi:uncharacterized C2H2 Zn-finger protein